jgi:flagellar hook protein FlgE
MINPYEFRKVYIAELGVDPYLLMALRSKHQMKKAQKAIEEIKAKHTDPNEAEMALVDLIKETWKSPRRKMFAGILLELGFKQDIISARLFHHLRQFMGATQYDDNTRKLVEEKYKTQVANPNPLNFLDGTAQPQVEQAPVTQEEPNLRAVAQNHKEEKHNV